MIEITDQILSEIVTTIVTTVNPERIILFGSRARNNAGQDSDLDLLIVEEEPFKAKRNRWREITKIRKALSRFRIPKDILVYSHNEMDKWRHTRNHVIAHCLQDGKTLYERS